MPRMRGLKRRAKAAAGSLAWHLRDYPPDELFVAYYHGTPRRDIAGFRDQLEFLGQTFVFLAPSDLDAYYDGSLREGPYVLFTFDDGIANNRLAAEALEEAGTRGLFFLIADWVQADAGEQPGFYSSRVRPSAAPDPDGDPDDRRSLTWDEARGLLDRGHWIGSHSASHRFVAAELSDEEAHREIVESRDRIAAGLGVPATDIAAFAAPIDSLRTMGRREVELARSTYRYVFTTHRGSNRGRDPYFVRRGNVESGWRPSQVRFSAARLTNQVLGSADEKRFAELSRP